VRASKPLDLVHVDEVVVFADVVRGDVVQLAGEVQPHAVGEVTAVIEGLTQNRVPRRQQSEHRGGVGLCARVWLHVGVRRAEQCLDPVDRQLLDDVDVLAAAVVAAPGIAFRVLVRQHRTLGFHHRQRGEVLAGDHLQRARLTIALGRDRAVDVGIDVGQPEAERGIGRGKDSHQIPFWKPSGDKLIYQSVQ
jgi:hypothetical protein